jgi:peptide-methionine (R)-S-oxide reductase
VIGTVNALLEAKELTRLPNTRLVWGLLQTLVPASAAIAPASTDSTPPAPQARLSETASGSTVSPSRTHSEGKTMHTWSDVVSRAKSGNPQPERRVDKTDAQWRSQLTGEQFQVTRLAGTERPFSSEMCSLFTPGIYRCVCCGTELFDATHKFESHSGWPSFTQPLKDNVVDYHGDNSHGMIRIEATCSTCDAHLGHVFPDGPPPTGLRYCMNAVSLEKVKE